LQFAKKTTTPSAASETVETIFEKSFSFLKWETSNIQHRTPNIQRNARKSFD